MIASTPRASTEPIVDLVFDVDCPNVDSARALLRTALEQVGATAQWREWDRASPNTPEALRGWGSPTILVDGSDVDGRSAMSTEAGTCCRLYLHEGRLRGVPALGDVLAALSRHGRSA
jgi:mercuric ion transport protein